MILNRGFPRLVMMISRRRRPQSLFDTVLGSAACLPGDISLGIAWFRQETCAKTSSRKDCLVNFFAHEVWVLRGYVMLAPIADDILCGHYTDAEKSKLELPERALKMTIPSYSSRMV